ncbi:unnamed protein product [Amoebophrya sp. A120]|nr:unnamed protein product [Amoebophrya sp. A120]|eukprot:GSA120T00013694001.1
MRECYDPKFIGSPAYEDTALPRRSRPDAEPGSNRCASSSTSSSASSQSPSGGQVQQSGQVYYPATGGAASTDHDDRGLRDNPDFFPQEQAQPNSTSGGEPVAAPAPEEPGSAESGVTCGQEPGPHRRRNRTHYRMPGTTLGQQQHPQTPSTPPYDDRTPASSAAREPPLDFGSEEVVSPAGADTSLFGRTAAVAAERRFSSSGDLHLKIDCVATAESSSCSCNKETNQSRLAPESVRSEQLEARKTSPCRATPSTVDVKDNSAACEITLGHDLQEEEEDHDHKGVSKMLNSGGASAALSSSASLTLTPSPGLLFPSPDCSSFPTNSTEVEVQNAHDAASAALQESARPFTGEHQGGAAHHEVEQPHLVVRRSAAFTLTHGQAPDL